jgi:hypothetical protein
MAHAFTVYPARPRFGTYTQNTYPSDYTANLRANLIYTSCKAQDKINSQGNRLLIKKLKYGEKCINTCRELPFNKTDLQINLLTKENLDGVLVLESKTNIGVPGTINPQNVPIYSFYNVDPMNKLYGTSQCGVNKYLNYMVLNTPATNYLLPGEVAGC